MKPRSVLDASALLAYLKDEPGADDAEHAMRETAAISAANLAETLSKLALAGDDPRRVAASFEQSEILDAGLIVEPLTTADAVVIAELAPRTRFVGLSLGDRACLALGLRLGVPVVTAERLWGRVGLGVPVRLIRP